MPSDLPQMMYTTGELTILARAYAAWSEIPLRRLGVLAVGTDSLFVRLTNGHGCLAASAESASDFFDQMWPTNLAWPAEVQRRPSGIKILRAHRKGGRHGTGDSGPERSAAGAG